MRKMILCLIAVTLLVGKVFAQTAPKAPAPSSNASGVGKSSELAGRQPKAIFLLKRARVDSAIGEPVLYPFERQTRTLYYELPAGVISNDPN